MYIAKVVGNVVATRKEESLVGCKLMVIQRVDHNNEPIDHALIAVDYVGAGIGEYVLVGTGSSVRVKRKDAPIDMAIIGIIDYMDV